MRAAAPTRMGAARTLSTASTRRQRECYSRRYYFVTRSISIQTLWLVVSKRAGADFGAA